jgi:sucrose-6F-phosphate phosphohydrolase
MTEINLQSPLPPAVLATDLDGTLIPLPEVEENRRALGELTRLLRTHRRLLVFATGRSVLSMEEAIATHGLPHPDWAVCDVGTTIHRFVGRGKDAARRYEEHLEELSGGVDRAEVEEALAGMEGVQMQDPGAQRRFKVSYYCEAERVGAVEREAADRCAARDLPYEALTSVDPFSGVGLLDFVPHGVSKAHALVWLATHADFHPGEVIYAGDSGNDLAALVAGFRAIVVGNARPELRAEVERDLVEKGRGERFFGARQLATSGVLEGCRHYGLFPEGEGTDEK